MLLPVLIAVAALLLIVLVLLGVASRRPDTLRVERSALISAPPATLFAEVNDLHRWQAWSPYVDFDPNMRTTYAGPESGVGASMAWSGNSKAGTGEMTIVDSEPDALIRIRLAFTKPFKATNTAEFTFVPQGNQAAVTWAMMSCSSLIFKAVGLFMNMDKMIGRDFERGLARLKARTEAV